MLVHDHQLALDEIVLRRRPGPNRLELRPDLLEHRRVKHPGRHGRLVAVLLEDVPGAEHQIVE